MDTTNEYAERIAKEFMKDITDHVFCHIQNNEDLMREYQTMVNHYSLQDVNTSLGRIIKDVFELKNIGESNSPKSWLIKSYTQHSK